MIWDKAQLARYAVAAACACALISLLCFAVPMYVIRPFRPQGPYEFPVAMAVRQAGPVISALCVVVAIAVLIRAWPRTHAGSRTILTLCALLAIAGAGLTRVNIFEIMFHPYASPEFEAADSIKLDNDDMVMSLTLDGNDVADPRYRLSPYRERLVGGWPVASTYCTLCHTGIVWKRVIDGQVIRLTGIRNGNALLRDEETGTIWQLRTDANTTFLRSGSLANGLMIDRKHRVSGTFRVARLAVRRTGQCLQPLNPMKDYWFDWLNYHPSTKYFGVDHSCGRCRNQQRRSGKAQARRGTLRPRRQYCRPRILRRSPTTDARRPRGS